MNPNSVSVSMATPLVDALEPGPRVHSRDALHRHSNASGVKLRERERFDGGEDSSSDDMGIEAIDVLRSQLLLRWFNETDHKSLATVSVDFCDAKATLSARLATAFAASGSRTLVIDADLYNPRLHAAFDVDNDLGLSEVLAGQLPLHAALKQGRIETLSILTAGNGGDRAESLLSKSRLIPLLQGAQLQFDVILLETPTWSAHANATMIGGAAGGVLVSVQRHRTHARSLRRLADGLKAASVPIVGAIFVES